MAPEDPDPLRLLPAPRRLERRPGAGCEATAPVRAQPDPGLPPQGFEITIGPDDIRIRHADDLALRYARTTLDQLRQQARGQLPALRILDWPDFAVRGYMLDISRDRVPTRETLELLVELLARLRLNHVELYTEHTFAYRDHERVWRDASPLTPEDVRWLDALCRNHGIELSANQNTFGHMERWLRHPAYRHLAECPEGWRTRAGDRRPPATLAPCDESLALVRELLAELLPLFSSRRVNVGCDETFELGQGRSQAAVRQRGRGRVYLGFLERILELVREHGRRALFWGDVVRAHPELIPELPAADAVALVWHYEAPVDPASLPAELKHALGRLGLDELALRGFAEHVGPFARREYPFWVCPGTSSWNSLVGRLPNARANLLDAADVGLDQGARGFLITDWGDHGHLQPPSVSFAPLAYGAAVAWCLEANRDLPLAPLLDAFVFADEAGQLGAAAERMGGAAAAAGLITPNASPLHRHLLRTPGLGPWGRLHPQRLAAVMAELDAAEAHVAAARPRARDGELVRRELAQAIRLARHGARRMARAAGLERPDPAELRRDLAEAIEEQRACWLARSRPGGLGDSLARLERTLAEYPR